MSRLVICWGLLGFGIVQLSCFDGLSGLSDLGKCWSQPDETAQTEIVELLSNSNYSEFTILRSTTIDRGNSQVPYDKEIQYFKYSLGGEYATFFSYNKPSGRKVINYGSNVEDYSREFGPFLTTYGILSSNNEVIGEIDYAAQRFPLSHLQDTDALITNYKIIINGIHNSIVDTIQVGFEPYFKDSMSVRSVYLEDLKFDASGNIVLTSATLDSKVELTTILWGTNYRDVIKKITDPSLIRVNSENEIDTLFNFPAYTDSISSPILYGLNAYYDFEFEPTKHGLFVKRNDNIHLLNETLKELSEPLYSGDLPIHISPNGKYVLNRTQLVDLETREVISLNEVFPNYRIGYVSNTKLVLSHNNNESISLIDIESLDIEAEITLSDVPNFHELDFLDYEFLYITEPIFNQNDELVFMLVRHSRQLDPNYECYD
jgi:hypothetical protein